MNRLQILRPRLGCPLPTSPVCGTEHSNKSLLKKHGQFIYMKKWKKCSHQLGKGRHGLGLMLRGENRMLKLLDPVQPFWNFWTCSLNCAPHRPFQSSVHCFFPVMGSLLHVDAPLSSAPLSLLPVPCAKVFGNSAKAWEKAQGCYRNKEVPQHASSWEK